MAIQIRNEPAQHIGVVNSAPCPEMNIVAKEITENGRYEARTEGVTGFDPVIVNVPSREEIGYENGYNDGYGKGSTDGYADALAKRTELEVTANGEYIPEGESTGFSKVSVNVPTGAENEDALISGTLSGHYRNDRVTKVNGYGFYSQNSLTSIDLPNATNIGRYAFYLCQNLTTINLPNVTTASSYAFWQCGKLISVNLPLLSQISNYALRECTSLERIYSPSAIMISANAFQGCKSLKAVILSGTSVCTLSNTNAFNECYHFLGTVNSFYNPEGLKDGYIYVPDDLVEDYKVATNWATYASQIKPISELEE